MTNSEVGMGAREAAAGIGVSRSFLIASDCPRHRYRGNGPKGRLLLVFYRSEVLAWWASREVRPASLRKVS
jgi:hypothetical protein